MRTRLGRVLLMLPLLAAVGCGKPARPRDDIFTEKINLPQLYIGLKTKKQVTAPASKGVFTDPDTQDEFWPAMECANPNCPARSGADPVLFVLPRTEPHRGCPSCLKVRDLKNESREQKAKYEGFVSLYVLPETKARVQELDEELARSRRP